MGKLKFPIIKGPGPKEKVLSMDDYFKFVIFNLKYTVDIKTCREQKKASVVDVRFTL